MKIWRLASLTGLTLAETENQTNQSEVHFNHDHDYPEVAQLEKWNALAQKLLRLHQDDFRPSFYRRWSGTYKPRTRTAKFHQEILKLEKNVRRNCAGTYQTPRRYDQGPVETYIDEVYDAENDSTGVTRKKRSNNQLQIENNHGRRLKHIVHNVKKWTEKYLTGCSNQEKVVKRWQRFTKKWEAEIDKSPAFQEELRKEERNLRNNDQPGRPCGRIYREFAVGGYYLQLYDSSYDTTKIFNDLRNTDFGNDRVKSMLPNPG